MILKNFINIHQIISCSNVALSNLHSNSDNLLCTDISSTMPVVYADSQNKLVINPDKDTDFFSAGAIVDVRKSYNTTDFDNLREQVVHSHVLLTTDKADNAYSGALIWRTDNNNASEPKAGIWLKTTNRQTSELHFGTTSYDPNGLKIADYVSLHMPLTKET